MIRNIWILSLGLFIGFSFTQASIGAEPVVSDQGSVKATGQIVNTVAEKSTKLDDGTYVRDDQGRVIETTSPDGALKMKFEYDEKLEPTKPTAVTIGDTTYKNIGAITSSGKPVEKGGFVMYSWSRYKGSQFIDNWYGYVGVSANGVFTQYDYNNDKVKLSGADGKELTADQAKVRNESGIWPGKVEVSRPDGSSWTASLKGRTVDSLTENFSDNGKATERTWKRDGARWVATDNAADVRTELSVDGKGDLAYVKSGSRFLIHKDGSKDITDGGMTRSIAADGTLMAVTSENGSTRRYEYSTDANGKRTLTSIKSHAGNSDVTWTRVANGDEWQSASDKESRLKLSLKDDGAIEFENAKGKLVRETILLARIEFDSDRPMKVSFPSGAQRTFSYDAKGRLTSFQDHVPVSGKPAQDTTWSRNGDTEDFQSKRDNGKTYQRTQVAPTKNGDIQYVGKDGNAHVSEALDLDRVSRGEFVMTGESVSEARDNLKTALAKTKLDEKRFLKWVQEFETKAATNKLSQEAVAKTLDNLSEILSSSVKSANYDQTQRETIVDTAMHNLARPLEIDQGSHPTCNVTSVEVYAAVRHPEEYSRLLKEVVLTGKWKTFAGETVTPPAEALKPGKDEKAYSLAKVDSGMRNLASQVVQMTLINGAYETGKMDTKTADKKAHRYIMGPNRTRTEVMNGQTVMIDVGEDLLVDGNKTPLLDKNGREIEGPEMVQDNVLASAVLFFGYEPPYIKCAGYADLPTGREYFNELPDKAKLLKWKADGKMPILTPTMGGAHSQTIHDVWEDTKTGELWVLLDNQHGEPEVNGSSRSSGEGDGDGWIKLSTLHDTLKMGLQGSTYGKPVMPVIQKYSHPSNPSASSSPSKKE